MKNKSFLTFLLTFTFYFIIQKSSAQTSIANAQAIFIYNFTSMVDWPETYRTGDFTIGVLGNCDLQGSIKEYINKKRAGIQNIVVKKFAAVEDISRCHILFIPFAKNKLLPDVINKLSTSSTLIICERAGSIEAGAAINFVIMEDKLKFEIRSANITKYGLRAHSNLESMGIVK